MTDIILRGEAAMSEEVRLNPQPLPPGAIDLGNLTAQVTVAVRNALEQRAATDSTPAVFKNPRIIIGYILEPPIEVRRGTEG